MLRHSRLVVACLVATVALAAAVGSASANVLELSNTEFRVVWARFESEAAGAVIRCPVTIEGSFHSATIAKVEHALIGHITRAIVDGAEPPCTSGTVTVLQTTLPWHVQYAGYTGVLMNPRRILLDIVGMSARVDPAGFLPACLLRTTAARPARAWAEREPGDVITGVTLDPAATIPLREGMTCEMAEARLAGTGTVRLLGSTTTTIRLLLQWIV